MFRIVIFFFIILLLANASISQIRKVHYIIVINKYGDTSELYEFDKNGALKMFNRYSLSSWTDPSTNKHTHKTLQTDYEIKKGKPIKRKETNWGFIEDFTYCKNFNMAEYKCLEEVTLSLNLPFKLSENIYNTDTNSYIINQVTNYYDTTGCYPLTRARCYTDSCLKILQNRNSTNKVQQEFRIINKKPDRLQRTQPPQMFISKIRSVGFWVVRPLDNNGIKCNEEKLDSLINSCYTVYLDEKASSNYYLVTDIYGTVGPFKKNIPFDKFGFKITLYDVEEGFDWVEGIQLTTTPKYLIKSLRFSKTKWKRINY